MSSDESVSSKIVTDLILGDLASDHDSDNSSSDDEFFIEKKNSEIDIRFLKCRYKEECKGRGNSRNKKCSSHYITKNCPYAAKSTVQTQHNEISKDKGFD